MDDREIYERLENWQNRAPCLDHDVPSGRDDESERFPGMAKTRPGTSTRDRPRC